MHDIHSIIYLLALLKSQFVSQKRNLLGAFFPNIISVSKTKVINSAAVKHCMMNRAARSRSDLLSTLDVKN
jgi:hypothetical protein